jgi:hypothetical protein
MDLLRVEEEKKRFQQKLVKKADHGVPAPHENIFDHNVW